WNSRMCSNSISVERGENRGVPAADSHGEFITEHYWGYTKRGAFRTGEYKVEHPKWDLFEPKNPRITVDFGRTYGERFSGLPGTEPHSVLLAKGSDIAVYKGAKIVNRES